MTNTRSKFSKLVELHAKTDRQLVAYISSRLDAGLTYALLVADPDTRKRWASTDAIHSNARKAYEEARSLLPCLRTVGLSDRRKLSGKVDRLRELLDSIPVSAESCLRAACF